MAQQTITTYLGTPNNSQLHGLSESFLTCDPVPSLEPTNDSVVSNGPDSCLSSNSVSDHGCSRARASKIKRAKKAERKRTKEAAKPKKKKKRNSES